MIKDLTRTDEGCLGESTQHSTSTSRSQGGLFIALGVHDKMGIFFANTWHNHNIDKWIALLDFADKVSFGKIPEYDYNSMPFQDLKKAYSWSAPEQLF